MAIVSNNYMGIDKCMQPTHKLRTTGRLRVAALAHTMGAHKPLQPMPHEEVTDHVSSKEAACATTRLVRHGANLTKSGRVTPQDSLQQLSC